MCNKPWTLQLHGHDYTLFIFILKQNQEQSLASFHKKKVLQKNRKDVILIMLLSRFAV